MATLDHILSVDRYYIGALHREPHIERLWDACIDAPELAELAARQRRSDERLIAWLDDADAAALGARVEMPRRSGWVQHDAAAHVLQHLFMHQTHHRGQVHAMLAGTRVAPPQLDEFLMPSEPQLRVEDMAALGWDEAVVYGPRA